MRAPLFIVFCLTCAVGNGQRIVTIAGLANSRRAEIDGKNALSAPLGLVYGLLLERDTGRLIFHDESLVERLEPDGTLLALAGIGRAGDGDVLDGVPASALRISILRGMAQEAAGALYLADAASGRVERVARDGTVTTFAGGGNLAAGSASDGLLATKVFLGSPRGMVFDLRGNLDIAEAFCRCIRRVDPAGVISTVYTLPPSATFTYFEGLAIDANDNLFTTEYVGHQVLKIAADGRVTTIAGTGVGDFSGDGGPAIAAELHGPSGIAVAPDGTLYIADTKNNRIRRITPDGIITTIAGTGDLGFSGDGRPAIAAALAWPAQVLSDGKGNLYVTDYLDGHVRKISAGGIITSVAGSGQTSLVDIPFPAIGDGGPAIRAVLNQLTAVALDAAGNLFAAELQGSRVRKIAPDGTITTVAGTGVQGATGDGGPATKATLALPAGIAVDAQSNIYVPTLDGRVRRIDPGGSITLVAGAGPGTGPVRSQGDGGPAVKATLNEPKGVAVDAAGNIYIADTSNARLRRVDPDGIIQTVAGPGQQGIDYWNAVAIDGQGNIFVATTHAQPPGIFSQVQRVNSDGTMTPVAGNGQKCSGKPTEFPAEGVQALQVPLCVVIGLAFDAHGILYISEPSYGAVLKMAPDGTITRIAGSLLAQTDGDGGPALSAGLPGTGYFSPGAVAVDAAGNLFIPSGNRIREVPVAPLVFKFSADSIAWIGRQSQAVNVSTQFADPLPYLVRIQAGAPWLTANRASGQVGEPITLTGDPTGLAPGVYKGTVIVTVPGVSPLEASLPVTLTVK